MCSAQKKVRAFCKWGTLTRVQLTKNVNLSRLFVVLPQKGSQSHVLGLKNECLSIFRMRYNNGAGSHVFGSQQDESELIFSICTNTCVRLLYMLVERRNPLQQKCNIACVWCFAFGFPPPPRQGLFK